MRIGIITTLDAAIPLIQFTYVNGLKPFVFTGISNYPESLQKIEAFCTYSKINYVAEINKDALYNWIKSIDADIIIVMGYAKKITLSKFKLPGKGIYNIHFGKLPQYRGAAPLFWQIKNNEPYIGMAIHILTDEVDEGDIVWETTIKNELHYNYTYLQQLLGNLAVNGFAFIMQTLLQTGNVISRPQGSGSLNYLHAPGIKDIFIKWNEMPAATIINLTRACNKWHTGAIALLNNNWEVRIADAAISSNADNNKVTPGTVTGLHDYYIKVACINNEELHIYSLTINGVFMPVRFAQQFGLQPGFQFKSTF